MVSHAVVNRSSNFCTNTTPGSMSPGPMPMVDIRHDWTMCLLMPLCTLQLSEHGFLQRLISRWKGLIMTVFVQTYLLPCGRLHLPSAMPIRPNLFPSPEPPPVVPWRLDVHTHAAQVQNWLSSLTPTTSTAVPRKQHLSSDTWSFCSEEEVSLQEIHPV